MKKWNLFLDDIRDLSFDKFKNSNWHHNKDWIIARSFDEAVILIKKYQCLPETISFDHDLGENDDGKELPNGYDFAKILVEFDMNDQYKFSKNFEYKVHSDNPVGSVNISSYLDNYLKYIKG